MLKQTLDAKHSEHEADLWADYSALYAGGQEFRNRIHHFLLQNHMEPYDVYRKRIKEASYRSYLGPIIDYFAAYLFSGQFHVRAATKEGDVIHEPDPYYSQFKEDCDGNGTDLHQFLHARFVEALIRRRGWWLVKQPADPSDIPPQDRAEFNDRKLGDGFLQAVLAEDVFDFEVDEQGELLWAIVHKTIIPRRDPRLPRHVITETWDLYDRENLETFGITYDPAVPPRDNDLIPSLGRRPHGFKSVPLVNIDVEDGLWVSNRVADAQKEHFRLSSAQSWGFRRTCYAMPVFKVEDATKPPVMGAGYYVMIGVKESMEWSAPPATPYESLGKEILAQKDEIFRLTHQMSIGVDNNAASVGRSAESKAEDANATSIILGAYATKVKNPIERTYQLLAELRDEDIVWSIEGLDQYRTDNPLDLAQSAGLVDQVGIPSETYHKEVKTRLALSLLPDIDQSLKDTIKQEIEDGVHAEIDLKEQTQSAMMEPAPGQQAQPEQNGQPTAPPAAAPPPVHPSSLS